MECGFYLREITLCRCDPYGNLAYGEYLHACRWKMPRLRESLSDGIAANANPIVRRAHEMGSRRVSKKRTVNH